MLLTDAELDHTLGLLVLREGSALTVLGTATVLTALTDHFPVRRLLRDYADLSWQVAELGVAVRLDDRLTATAFAAGHKHPRYVGSPLPDEGAVVGYRLADTRTGRVAVYAPAVARWDGALAAVVATADCVIVDGTFWTDDELPRTGTGRRDGRELYTHVNNTNPALLDGSAEHRELVELGIEIGRAGLRVEL